MSGDYTMVHNTMLKQMNEQIAALQSQIAEKDAALEFMNQNCISIGLHNSRMEAREMELEKAQKERDEYRVKAEQLFGYSFEQGVKLHDAVTALEKIADYSTSDEKYISYEQGWHGVAAFARQALQSAKVGG